MVERQPSIREIRSALRNMAGETDFGKDPEETLRRLVSRFPNLTPARAIEAVDADMAATRREADRHAFETQRMVAVREFLQANTYAHLEEAADDLGLFDLQEVWDYVMAQAELPPSTAPKTIEIE